MSRYHGGWPGLLTKLRTLGLSNAHSATVNFDSLLSHMPKIARSSRCGVCPFSPGTVATTILGVYILGVSGC